MAWSKSTRITIMLAIDTAFLILELGVGVAVGSLALMADAFHMLNDIISLVVGLWAVKAAQKSSTDKYSFGWLRAEILGAFFNAVFLIALCLSIVLEAIQRLIDPPVINNAMLILIVGSLGLTSNLAGFFVLGGHGHSHGPGDDHAHSHGDEIRHAEEGHSEGHEGHGHTYGEAGHPGEVFPEALISKAKAKGHRIRFSESDDAPTSSNKSPCSPRKSRRRTSSIRSGRFNPEDFSIHPASFRQDIIAASRPQLDGIDSGDNTASEEEAVDDEDDVTENSPLLVNGDGANGRQRSHEHNHNPSHDHSKKPRHDSWHESHNHNQPKKRSKASGDHNHADMGMNAMILHVMGDALGNIGVIVSALIIWLTEWPGKYYADPAVSLFITLIILRSTIPLTSATAKILLQATPDHLDVTDIKDDIQALPGVIVASMHIQIGFPISEASGEKYMDLARQVRKCLHAYGIHSATIQPEFCLDKDHGHNPNAPIVGLDGIVGQPRCGLDDDLCLLECVDNCKGRGCCSPKTVEPQHDHSDHDGHIH